MALTCHHIVLLSISIHPKVKEWEIYIIRPPEETNLTMDMPSRLDHLETVASYNEGIKKDHTAADSTIRMRLRDPQDFIMERRAIYERTETGTTRSARFSYPYGVPNIYEMTETAIVTTKDTPRKAEDSFKRSKGTFWPFFFCSIQPPATIPTCYSTNILWLATHLRGPSGNGIPLHGPKIIHIYIGGPLASQWMGTYQGEVEMAIEWSLDFGVWSFSWVSCL